MINGNTWTGISHCFSVFSTSQLPAMETWYKKEKSCSKTSIMSCKNTLGLTKAKREADSVLGSSLCVLWGGHEPSVPHLNSGPSTSHRQALMASSGESPCSEPRQQSLKDGWQAALPWPLRPKKRTWNPHLFNPDWHNVLCSRKWLISKLRNPQS